MDVEMKIADMNSGSSEKRIKEALHRLEGIGHIEIHPDHHLIKITYDQEQISLEKICDTIENQGYTGDR